MKKIYESPAFFAEEYTFSDSIAKCVHSVDPNYSKPIKLGDNVCGGGMDGHCYGGQNGKSGTIAVRDLEDGTRDFGTVVLFNDLYDPGENVDHTRCQFDWDYRINHVFGPDNHDYGSFAAAFYGNEANEDKHSAGYMGSAFYS